MEFTKFRDRFIEHFNELVKGEPVLVMADIDKDEFYNLYLNSFPEGTNKIYRKRRVYDCSCCRHFLKRYGGIMAVKDGKYISIWDFDVDEPFKSVVEALSKYVHEKEVTGIFLSDQKRVGIERSPGTLEDGTVVYYNHFYLDIPNAYMKSKSTIGDVIGSIDTDRSVFKRTLEEITLEAAESVMELICSNTLYKGEEWKSVLKEFINFKKEYNSLSTNEERDVFVWQSVKEAGTVLCRLKNHSIGVLLCDISNGVDLDKAVTSYEKITAPSNYKRPKPIYTKKMLEDAKKKISELGYMDSLSRRYATLDDITVNNILFSNKDASRRVKKSEMDSVFEDMEKGAKSSPKKFSKVEEIPVEKFISDVLPNASELELYMEGRLENSMVSLIAPVNSESKSMFKWGNSFGWAYSGNMTDSLIKERVKNAGGNVTGDLRFSIQWNDGVKFSKNDLDAHCIVPSGEEIYFSHMRSYDTGGFLDVDVIHPKKDIPAVENIAFDSRDKMIPGTYKFYVHQYTHRGGRDGFRAEIEFDGQIFNFDYTEELRPGEKVYVADVTLNKDGSFSIKKHIDSSCSSRNIWGVSCNEFVPVSVVMLSPNYWDEQDGIGHKHYFFMLKDCVNPEEPNGFYNEFLKQELHEHRKVLEALGSKMHVEFVEDQLSGVGFSSTKRDNVIVKVKGNTERVMKVLF